jgi:hypothetical protein
MSEYLEDRSKIADGEIIVNEDTAVTVLPDRDPIVRRRSYIVYLMLPMLFLTVALLGGLRLSATDGSFIFLKPPLVCLLFAAALMALFARSGMIVIGEWLSEEKTIGANIANAVVLGSLFVASTQLFNSLVPEQGIPYWVVAFCFFWTLWNNLFADFDTRRLFRSLAALFGLAFVAKYLLLANLASPAGRGWFENLVESPTRAAAGWLLDVPAFSAGTGYIQFFAVGAFLLGLYLYPPTPPAAE